jgi:2,3-bisphosphoglycerate-independent phosphoglycerate mutase
MNRFIQEAFERLNDHPVNARRRAAGLLPANGIITRGAGMLREVHNFLRHLHLSVAVVAAERTVLGLGKLFHFNCIVDPRFTALPDTDLSAKVEITLNALKNHDLVFLHVKGTDVYGHDLNPQGKKTMIEMIDGAIAPLLEQDIVIGVSADHSTDSAAGRHCGDPVPSVITARRCRRDRCTGFGESQCAHGGLVRIRANAFILSVLDNMGCLQNYRTTDARFLRGF